MKRPHPKIEPSDPRPVVLSGRVEVPTRFRATFADRIATSIEVEMVAGKPVVREITMSSDTDDLASIDLRPALRSKFLPAAIQAACREQLIGRPRSNQKMAPVTRDELPDSGMIGPMTVVGRLASSADDYATAAQQTRPRRPGRPKVVTEPGLLSQIAETYSVDRSPSDVRRKFPMSRSTVYRRIEEARAAGLID